MAKKSTSIPFRIFMKDNYTGETYAWESLSEEQKARYIEQMGKNAGCRMSDYYSSHIEQFERL
ncbi:MAG: hypothetical protein IJD49_04360 [Clostridia bacterium]|nr:hypothetical protein [Clostridia bacterium]